ncbi:hypothetical protein N9903_01330 [bacterium]|nr:hypothetical protein [bacterium]
MGGYGSGFKGVARWTVENCRCIDISKFGTEGALRLGRHTSGQLTWSNNHTGEETASVGYEVNARDASDAWLRLHYAVNAHGPDHENIDYKVPLETTRPNFGGLRWWFLCPAVGCERRVRKLYLRGKYFACRHCYKLTYTSCQDSYKSDRMFADFATDIPGMTASEVKKIFKQDR